MEIIKKNNKVLVSYIHGAVLAVLFVTLATIVGELVPVFKDWLKTTFYHHWVGKGILSVVVFVLVAFFNRFFIKNKSDDEVVSGLYLLTLVTILCSFILLGFFVYESAVHN